MVARGSRGWAELLGTIGTCAIWCAAIGCTSGTVKSGGTTYNLDNTTIPADTIRDAGDEAATPPDGPSACPVGACNYQTQLGCGPSGDAGTCIPAVTTSGAVVPTCVNPGLLGEGEDCSRWDACGRGLVCADHVCRRLCCGRDWTGCASDQRCVAPLSVTDDSSALPTGAYVCVPGQGCDALSGAPCAAGTVCQIVDPTGATACVAAPPAGVGAQPGDPCPACQTGFTCVAQGCRRLCSASGQGGVTCPPEEGQCVHWHRDPVDVGECSPVN